jgi:hypothetical protein
MTHSTEKAPDMGPEVIMLLSKWTIFGTSSGAMLFFFFYNRLG